MDRIWTKNYPKNVPLEISSNKYHSLLDLFYATTNLFREKTAFRNLNSSLTFGEIEKYSERFASYLQKEEL